MAIVRHGNWVTIRREEWSFCAPVSTLGWDSWMHVSLTRYKTVVPQLCNRGRNFIGRGRPLLTRAASRDWQHSLSLARGPKAHGLKLTSARSIYPREGKKGAKEKARFYWTSALLHRQLHIAPPIKLSLLASVTRAFFFSSSLFFTIDAIIPRLSLYKLESRWVYKILSVLVFFSFLFFETMENGEDSKIRGFGNQRFEDSCPPFSPYYSSRRRVVVSFRNHR